MRNRTMDYERMYKKALERARAIYQGKYKPETAATIAETLQSIFPELVEPVESEDEKIRKDLINWVKTNISYERMPVGMNFSNECVLAWLEKQGEQHPEAERKAKVVENRIYSVCKNGNQTTNVCCKGHSRCSALSCFDFEGWIEQ